MHFWKKNDILKNKPPFLFIHPVATEWRQCQYWQVMMFLWIFLSFSLKPHPFLECHVLVRKQWKLSEADPWLERSRDISVPFQLRIIRLSSLGHPLLGIEKRVKHHCEESVRAGILPDTDAHRACSVLLP